MSLFLVINYSSAVNNPFICILWSNSTNWHQVRYLLIMVEFCETWPSTGSQYNCNFFMTNVWTNWKSKFSNIRAFIFNNTGTYTKTANQLWVLKNCYQRNTSYVSLEVLLQWWLWSVLFLWDMWCQVVLWKLTDVSQEFTAYLFRVGNLVKQVASKKQADMACYPRRYNSRILFICLQFM